MRDGTTSDEIVRLEHQEQIANHATVRNVITSMRLLSSADWADFFESVSLVHEALCDGTRVAEMDFPTRDRYRHAVEELSRASAHDELEVARRAVAMAAEAATSAGGSAEAAEARLGDPGYYRTQYSRLRGVTPNDVKRVANTYLGAGRVVLSVVPTGKLDQASRPDQSTKVTVTADGARYIMENR